MVFAESIAESKSFPPPPHPEDYWQQQQSSFSSEQQGAYLRFMNGSPLARTIREAFGGMSSLVHTAWVGALRKVAEQYQTFDVGTGFSGTDIVVKVLLELSIFWKEAFNVDFSFVHKWACESDPDKQRFLKDHARAPKVFVDFDDLKYDKAMDG